MTVHLQYKGGADWRIKKLSHISISKAPGTLFRTNTVIKFTWSLQKLSQHHEILQMKSADHDLFSEVEKSLLF